jgi:hypothetical protein
MMKRKGKRIISFISLFMLLGAGVAFCGSIVIEEADATWQASFGTPTEGLCGAAYSVAPKLTAEYFDKGFLSSLNLPSQTFLDKAYFVAPKLTAEYFDLGFLSSLNLPSQSFLDRAALVAPKLTAEYFDEGFLSRLNLPSQTFLEKAADVAPKLTAEYFDKGFLSGLNPPSQTFLDKASVVAPKITIEFYDRSFHNALVQIPSSFQSILHLLSYGTISGTIKNILNNPISGCLVEVFRGTTTIATATTNQDGKYAIPDIIGGIYGSVTYSVSASRDGFVPATTTTNAKAGATCYAHFSLWFLPPVITNILPSFGTNTGTISTTISGFNFRSGADARLTKASFEIIGQIIFVNTQTLTVIFNLKEAVLGSWSLVVTNIEGQSDILVNGFCILGTETSIAGPIIIYDSFGNILGTSSTIQGGVNACPQGGTVSVLAGTYTGAVYI